MVMQSKAEDIDPICKIHGCQQQIHFKSIRRLQEVINKLEEKLRGYEKG